MQQDVALSRLFEWSRPYHHHPCETGQGCHEEGEGERNAEETWLVALGRQNARQRDGAALGGYAVSRRRSAVSGPREVDVRPAAAVVRVCNEGVGEWQHAMGWAQGGDGEASSPFLHQQQWRKHPNASMLTALLPGEDEGEVTCSGCCRDGSCCCYSSSLVSGLTPGRDEQAREGKPGRSSAELFVSTPTGMVGARAAGKIRRGYETWRKRGR